MSTATVPPGSVSTAIRRGSASSRGRGSTSATIGTVRPSISAEPLYVPGGVDLGPASAGERYAWGGALRLEGHARGKHVDPFALVTWGIYQVHDELRGSTLDTDLAAGLGLGAGVLRPINGEHAIGVVLRGQWLSRGEAQRYLSAALEWRWAWRGAGATPAPAGGTTTPR